MKTSTICDNCGMSYVWFDRDALNKSWITLGIPVVIYGILFYEFVVKYYLIQICFQYCVFTILKLYAQFRSSEYPGVVVRPWPSCSAARESEACIAAHLQLRGHVYTWILLKHVTLCGPII